jgi:very-short-patch-repair endonuclease
VALPSVDELIMPLLEQLADGAEHSTRELWERLTLRFGLSGAELAERLPDGRHVFLSRVQQARTRLRKRGLLDYPRRSHARITAAGLETLLAGEPRAGTHAPPAVTLPAPHIGPGPFETEVRSLTGPAASAAADWTAIRLLNGWSAEGILSYAEVARRTGRSIAALHELDLRCLRDESADAPALDAVLGFSCAHPWQDARELSFHLAQLGLVWTPFSPAGICEAARRFGREQQWRTLVRALATSRGRGTPDDPRLLPRPFESWFEVEVFLFLEDLGVRAWPQEHVGVYRADLVVEELASPLVIECDGETWHRGDRTDRDLASEHAFLGRGYTVIRIRHCEWRERTARIQDSLRATLRELDPLRSAG